MKSRRWILPALLALPFVVVAVIDVYRTAARRSLEDVVLLSADPPFEFEPTGLVADFRSQPPGSTGKVGEVQVDFGSGWGDTVSHGRWTAGPRFDLGMALPAGGQTALYIEGRVDRNQDHGSRLMLTIDGREAGGVDLGRKIELRLLSVPAGLLHGGDNRLEFRLGNPSKDHSDVGRTALIKRLAVAADDSGGFPAQPPHRPARLTADGRSVVVTGEGRLTLPFEVPVSGSVLNFRFKFRSPEPGARCRVVVARRYSNPERFDVVREKTIAAGGRGAGRFRQVLRDRGESSALFVFVNAAAARGGFVLRDPTIIIRPNKR